MSFIFNSTADVGVFLGLLVLSMFGQGISAAFAVMGDMKRPKWFDDCLRHIKVLAPLWVFFLLTFVVYILMVAGYYSLYRSVALTGLFGEAIDIITLTLLFDSFLALLWVACFFGFHRPGWSMAIIGFQWGTGIILMYYDWQNAYNLAFGVTLVRAVWFLYPFVVTCWTLYEMYYHGRFPKGGKHGKGGKHRNSSDDTSNA